MSQKPYSAANDEISSAQQNFRMHFDANKFKHCNIYDSTQVIDGEKWNNADIAQKLSNETNSTP